jgi:hypothetical protein
MVSSASGENGKSDVAGNFATLMKASWKDIAFFVGGFFLKVAIGVLLGLLTGAIVGIILYIIMKKYGAFRTHWKWYRFVGWLWGPMFALSLMIAFGYAGAWVGTGKAGCDAIQDQHVLRKTVANLYCAIMLDELEYTAKGTETASEIVLTLEDGEALVNLTFADIKARAKQEINKQLEENGEQSAIKRFLLERMIDKKVGNTKFYELLENDPSKIILMVYMYAMQNEKFMKNNNNNQDNMLIIGIIADYFQSFEKAIVSEIKSFAGMNAFICILIGLAVPFGSLSLFRASILIANRKSRSE